MGELREPWHTKQVELLDRHLHLLHLYSQAKENLAAFKGKGSSVYPFLVGSLFCFHSLSFPLSPCLPQGAISNGPRAKTIGRSSSRP